MARCRHSLDLFSDQVYAARSGLCGLHFLHRDKLPSSSQCLQKGLTPNPTINFILSDSEIQRKRSTAEIITQNDSRLVRRIDIA